MEKSDFVIVGGVAAGPKAAATLARRLPGASITLFQKEDELSYATCGMPFFASGELSDFQELTQTPFGVVRNAHFFRQSKRFEAVTGAEVVSIDRTAHNVTVKNLATGDEVQHGYGKLVLATGARPAPPKFPVTDSPVVQPFTRPDDARGFRQLAQRGQIGSVAVIGAGFIGCELAEAVRDMWGIEATVIERESQILPYVLDPEMAAMVQRELGRQEITVLTGSTVEGVSLNKDDGRPVVKVSGQDPLTVDYVFLCMGVRPSVELAREAGLEIGKTGGIVVDRTMRTSDPDIYAGGDCVETTSLLTGQPMYIPMGSLANRHGRVIAENLAGNTMEYEGALGAFVLREFELNVGTVGLTAESASRAGITAEAVWGSFSDKPDYFPESKRIAVKMVYESGTDRLLGLQAIGAGDVCRRIDVFSTMLSRRASIDDLFGFEHCYAPPFSEALDPLHHLAGMARAKQRGMDFVPLPSRLDPKEADIWIDVREANEVQAHPLAFDRGEAEVRSIPLNDLVEAVSDLDSDKRIIIVCQRGSRSYQAVILLNGLGFTNVRTLSGGLHGQM